ncbi:hypothetical protein Fmac_025886 [Flemingia macrophylla]|uniref:Uncharacterized protein n=1 Tax=Flemingia macrophylla TaxID=520843 RepID=A0ABD1LDB4_9FABA
MSHRDASTNLYAINFTCNDDLDDSEIVDSLIDHVTLSPTIQLLSIVAECPVTKLPQLSLCHSLTTLRLDDIATEATGFEFVSLQCFHLFDCRFECGSGDTLDLFRGCITLQDLCMQDCVYYGRVKRFKISAPHLVHLSVSGMRVDEEFDSDCIIELFTPKLQTFTYSDSHVYKFSVKVNLSLLQKVNIVLDYLTTDMDANLSLRLFELFEVVGSAKSVFLSPVVIKVLSMFPNLMKGRPSPFSRVTIFKLITDGPLYSYLIPTNVMTYLFGGSPEMRRWNLNSHKRM